MSLSPTVRAGWCAWTRQFEGCVATMYQDSRQPPVVTVGYGCALFSADDACEACIRGTLGWLHADGISTATWEEIRAEWRRVHAMPGGHLPSFYAVSGRLELDDEAIEALALTRLDADVAILERTFGDLSALPDAAVMVVLSLAWAEGAGYVAHYPHFVAAILARDWAKAAAECGISEVGNAGVRLRNVADRALLLSLV